MPDTWTITYEHTFDDGKQLKPGWMFRIHGERGRIYRYIKTITNTRGDTWIECFGGAPQRQQSRAFRPEKINTASIKNPNKEKTTTKQNHTNATRHKKTITTRN